MHCKNQLRCCALVAFLTGLPLSGAHAGPAVATVRLPEPPLPPLTPATPILRAGLAQTYAIMPNGTLKDWGSNSDGQLAWGYTGSGMASPVVPPPFAHPIVDLATAYSHACVVLDDLTVQCFGSNSSGQLGDGTTTSSGVPLTVAGVSSAVRVATGSSHSCALLADGHVQCWGQNSAGQLGDHTFVSRGWPSAVAGLTDVLDIAARADHTCARLRNGEVACWGSGLNGELGNGYRNSPTALRVLGLGSAYQLALGDTHSCALLSAGGVACWGSNSVGQLGVGSSVPYSNTPHRVPLDSIDSIASGANTTCVTTSVRGGNNAFCWGYNYSGQIGDGSTSTRFLPTQVQLGGARAVSLAGGTTHTCAVLPDSSARCWGNNWDGQGGFGSSPTASLLPRTVLSFP